jgi:ferredoxin
LKEEVKIIIKVDNFETTIKGSKDQTILDTALENDVEAPYSCQGGAQDHWPYHCLQALILKL